MLVLGCTSKFFQIDIEILEFLNVTPHLAGVMPNMQNVPNHCSMQIFFTSGLGPDILVNGWKIALYFLFGQFCLVFITSKNQGFQSGALLKMPPLSSSMEEFGSDINKEVFEHTKKMQVSKAGSSITRLFASIRY